MCCLGLNAINVDVVLDDQSLEDIVVFDIVKLLLHGFMFRLVGDSLVLYPCFVVFLDPEVFWVKIEHG